LLTFEQIKELIELVARHQLSGVEVDRSGFHLKIDGFRSAREAQGGVALPAAAPGTLVAVAAPALTAVAAPVLGQAAGLPQAAVGSVPSLAPTAAGAGAPAAPAGGPAKDAPHVLDSPIVGTFYRAPSPEAQAFVEVGTRVRKGQVVCIIEAMKLMNEIESDVAGTIVEIYPQNAQAVEFGEPLFAINTAS
jgi:acetyl-CoA carboxylase biotin carboxyl carrier protein